MEPKKKSLTLIKKEDFLRNLSPDDKSLYNAIREWRKKTADEENVPPYVIFGDKTLEELVEKKPRNQGELRNVFGIGSVKAEKIGSQVLRLIESLTE